MFAWRTGKGRRYCRTSCRYTRAAIADAQGNLRKPLHRFIGEYPLKLGKRRRETTRVHAGNLASGLRFGNQPDRQGMNQSATLEGPTGLLELARKRVIFN